MTDGRKLIVSTMNNAVRLEGSRRICPTVWKHADPVEKKREREREKVVAQAEVTERARTMVVASTEMVPGTMKALQKMTATD